LSTLHAEGGIAPSGMAAVVKEKKAGGALATLATALIGGALVGRGADLLHRGDATAFVDQVSRQLASAGRRS